MTEKILNHKNLSEDIIGGTRKIGQYNGLNLGRITSLPITGPTFRPKLNLIVSDLSPNVNSRQNKIKIQDLSKFHLSAQPANTQPTLKQNGNMDAGKAVYKSEILSDDLDYNSMLDDIYSDDLLSPRRNKRKTSRVSDGANTQILTALYSDMNSVKQVSPDISKSSNQSDEKVLAITSSTPVIRPSSPRISVPIVINGKVRNELSNGHTSSEKSVEDILNIKPKSVYFDHFTPKVNLVKSNRTNQMFSIPKRVRSPPITKSSPKQTPRKIKLNLPSLVLNTNHFQKSLDTVEKDSIRNLTGRIPSFNSTTIETKENDEDEADLITVIRMTRINGQGDQEYYYLDKDTGEEIELSSDQIPDDSDIDEDSDEPENVEQDSGIGAATVPHKNIPPTSAKPLYDKSSMFYQINEIPNYQAMTPTDRARIRADFITKFGILRKAFPEFKIPALNPDDSLEVVHIQYKRYISQIHIENAADKWKIFLVIGWVVLELGGVKGLGLNLTGYTMAQITMMNKYQQLLIELGEAEQLDIGGDWPVYVRIIGLSLFNGCIFLATRYLGKFLGPAAGKAVQMVLGVVSGEEKKGTQEGQGSDSNPGPETPPEKQSKGAGLAGLISNFMPMISGFLGGNKSGDSKSGGKPQRRRPIFDE